MNPRAESSRLSPDAKGILRPLMKEDNLGASRFVRQMADGFCAYAEGWKGTSPTELISEILAIGDFLVETRGANTPVIANAARILLRELRDLPANTVGEVAELMRSRRDEYMLLAESSRDRIATLGGRLLGALDAVVAFDYSSTVMAILKRVADNGKSLKLVVPESRCLDGGRPIVNGATAMGHEAVFVVDFAIAAFLRRADAVLFGAETIFANGDCWNTVGSYPIVSLASQSAVPCYVASELLKMDHASFDGAPRAMRDHDFSKVLDYPNSFAHPDKVSVVGPDLDLVPASMIRGYITEVGILPPTHLWRVGERYLKERGVVDERGQVLERDSAEMQ